VRKKGTQPCKLRHKGSQQSVTKRQNYLRIQRFEIAREGECRRENKKCRSGTKKSCDLGEGGRDQRSLGLSEPGGSRTNLTLAEVRTKKETKGKTRAIETRWTVRGRSWSDLRKQEFRTYGNRQQTK